MTDDISDRVKFHGEQILSKDWATLRKVDFSWRRSDGQWQRMSREVYDRGGAAVILLYDPERRTVVLTSQFRMAPFQGGYRGLMVEAAAGMLDGEDPTRRVIAEAEEETGYALAEVTRLFHAFMAPGSMTEAMHFFVGRYNAAQKTGAGGGHPHEGEDIEVLEMPFDDAYAMIADGRIVDAKTIILLQWAKLNVFA
ncbi:MAG: NUDIX domain-containing protein [Alphaproteobacteria bacterium]|nr:NUDIX domain-containing protein [Alphaproteobacteria bacterium]MBL6940012.1 NUDIX domain-containing protein [Alphaproteobacteria bacterium]MBL7098132.1 NUDIX domain-containing protein [Alphaproteobacteria bacterium]